MGLQREIVWKL